MNRSRAHAHDMLANSCERHWRYALMVLMEEDEIASRRGSARNLSGATDHAGFDRFCGSKSFMRRREAAAIASSRGKSQTRRPENAHAVLTNSKGRAAVILGR